jgi:hypothetical protein
VKSLQKEPRKSRKKLRVTTIQDPTAFLALRTGWMLLVDSESGGRLV